MQDPKGGWKATRAYYMTKDTWESSAIQLRFANGVPISTADPSVGSIFNFLTVESRAASYEDSSTVLLTITYTGAPEAQWGGEDGNQLSLEAQPLYRLECRLRDLPFSDHPKWKALDDDERYLLGKVLKGDAEFTKNTDQSFTKAVWKYEPSAGIIFVGQETQDGSTIELSSTEALNFSYWLNEGQTTYLSPTFTWTETTQGNSKTTSNAVNVMGKIDTPRGDPPSPTGTRNWMMTSSSQEQRGELYQTTIEWTLSEDGEWDSFIYS